MEELYQGWGAYIAALGVQIAYWLDVGPMVQARAQSGLKGGGIFTFMPLVAIGALSLIAWPFYAGATLYKYEFSSLFTVLLITAAAVVAGLAIAFVLGFVSGSYMMAGSPGHALKFRRVYEVVIMLAAIALPAFAYYLTWYLD